MRTIVLNSCQTTPFVFQLQKMKLALGNLEFENAKLNARAGAPTAEADRMKEEIVSNKSRFRYCAISSQLDATFCFPIYVMTFCFPIYVMLHHVYRSGTNEGGTGENRDLGENETQGRTGQACGAGKLAFPPFSLSL